MTYTKEHGMDLFEFFEVMWNGKWFIIFAILMTCFTGIFFVQTNETHHESIIKFTTDTTPPFYKEQRVVSDFQKFFYSQSTFEKWKKNSSGAEISFEDLSLNAEVDGFVLSRNKRTSLSEINISGNGRTTLIIRTDKLGILNDIYDYCNFINQILKNNYVNRARDELQIVTTRFKDLGAADSVIVETVLDIDRFIVSAEKGSNIFMFERPTFPKKTSPSLYLVITASFIFGGIIGVLFVLVHASLKGRK